MTKGPEVRPLEATAHVDETEQIFVNSSPAADIPIAVAIVLAPAPFNLFWPFEISGGPY